MVGAVVALKKEISLSELEPKLNELFGDYTIERISKNGSLLRIILRKESIDITIKKDSIRVTKDVTTVKKYPTLCKEIKKLALTVSGAILSALGRSKKGAKLKLGPSPSINLLPQEFVTKEFMDLMKVLEKKVEAVDVLVQDITIFFVLKGKHKEKVKSISITVPGPDFRKNSVSLLGGNKVPVDTFLKIAKKLKNEKA